MTVVSNACPLVLLARCGRFALLGEVLGPICVPQAVFDEVCVKGAGRPGDREVKAAAGQWLEVRQVVDGPLVRSLVTNLGRGEAEAIALAVESHADLLLLDDRRARATAEFMGLSVTGTVGVLLRGQRAGLVPDLAQAVLDLRTAGLWVSDQAWARIKAVAGLE